MKGEAQYLPPGGSAGPLRRECFLCKPTAGSRGPCCCCQGSQTGCAELMSALGPLLRELCPPSAPGCPSLRQRSPEDAVGGQYSPSSLKQGEAQEKGPTTVSAVVGPVADQCGTRLTWPYPGQRWPVEGPDTVPTAHPQFPVPARPSTSLTFLSLSLTSISSFRGLSGLCQSLAGWDTL